MTFANVSFSYGDDIVLDDISSGWRDGGSCCQRRGQINHPEPDPRFFDVDKGQITIDGADGGNEFPISETAIRQDAVLFDDTIAANILRVKQRNG